MFLLFKELLTTKTEFANIHKKKTCGDIGENKIYVFFSAWKKKCGFYALFALNRCVS